MISITFFHESHHTFEKVETCSAFWQATFSSSNTFWIHNPCLIQPRSLSLGLGFIRILNSPLKSSWTKSRTCPTKIPFLTYSWFSEKWGLTVVTPFICKAFSTEPWWEQPRSIFQLPPGKPHSSRIWMPPAVDSHGRRWWILWQQHVIWSKNTC